MSYVGIFGLCISLLTLAALVLNWIVSPDGRIEGYLIINAWLASGSMWVAFAQTKWASRR